jgi:hypothetical protein
MVRRSILSILALVVAVSLGACASNHTDADAKPRCKLPKGGTIITANEYCAVVNDDPVDPAVPFAEWKGQKIGFCCKGCLPKWNKMTDAEKDAGVSAAIARGKVGAK